MVIMNLKKILVGIDGIKAKGEIDRKASQQMEHSI